MGNTRGGGGEFMEEGVVRGGIVVMKSVCKVRRD